MRLPLRDNRYVLKAFVPVIACRAASHLELKTTARAKMADTFKMCANRQLRRYFAYSLS